MTNYFKKIGIATLGLGALIYSSLCPLDVNAGTKFGETIRGLNQTTEQKQEEKKEKKKLESDLGGYGGNLTGFYAPVESTIKYKDEVNGIDTKLKGNLFGGNVYVKVPVGKKLMFIPVIGYSSIDEKISNSSNSNLGTLKTNKLEAGVLAQFLLKDGKLLLEPSVGYENQNTNIKMTSLNTNLEETVSNIKLGGGLQYTIPKGKVAFGPKGDFGVNFTDIKQKKISKNATTFEGEVGGFIEGDGWNISLTVGYDQAFDIESNSTLNGVNIGSEGIIGNNLYAFLGGKSTIASQGIDRTQFAAGGGIEKISEKLPVGIKVFYFNNTEGFDNKITKVKTNENGVMFQLSYKLDGKKLKKISPLKLIPKQR